MLQYTNINLIEYGQNVDRRYIMAALVSPLFILSKKRQHFLTLGYTDCEQRQQAMVFKVDKKKIRALLVSLEARTGLKVQFQDETGSKGREGMNTTRSLLALVTALGCMALGCMANEPHPLTKVKRVHIEKLAGDRTAAQIRDMIINALQASNVFVVTENPERADAILRGSAEDEIFTDTFQTSEGVNARASLSGGTGTTACQHQQASGRQCRCRAG